MGTVMIDGRCYQMAHIRGLYREQREAERKAKQLALFELKEDARPRAHRHASGRYEEPTLF